jgi:N-acetyl sugar amidotransferase
MKNKNLIKLYNLPKEIKFCKKCTISNQRPRINFDSNGVCSACNYTIYKKNKINWKIREKELLTLLNKYRKKDGSHDVIVPCSGGKDSSYVAHQLKHKYGMNPLTVTFSPLKYTDIGRKNFYNFINSGFDNILGTPNGDVARKITYFSFRDLGDPFQTFIYGQVNFPLKIACQYNIPLIMYGENGEAEYGGDISKAKKPTRDTKDFKKYYFSGLDVNYWKKRGINKKDLSFFEKPPLREILRKKIKIHFFGYYKYWDPQENFYYCQQNTNYSPNIERNEGTYSKYASIDDRLDGFHYYLSYIKFGIGRATSDTAHEIRDEKISRDEGVQLVKKFDGEFPNKHFKEFLEYCQIDEGHFFQIIDSWRSDHIWKKNRNNWILKKAIWN